jgi:hypothetical protein
MARQWYCYNCGYNAKIEIWASELSPILGDSYVCKCCAMGGHFGDLDAPKMLDDDVDRLPGEPDYYFVKRIWGI